LAFALAFTVQLLPASPLMRFKTISDAVEPTVFQVENNDYKSTCFQPFELIFQRRQSGVIQTIYVFRVRVKVEGLVKMET
jgi:hypothetical protein